ncbi:MAG: hypothetical protein HFI64_02570 [Lachnospiraceae bacterium]|nr:hypothetical protein [Lachnospiraceae bacterium]
MKKKLILIGVAAILVMTALIGGSLAYFQADGREVRQQLGTRRLGISLMGDTEGPERLQDGNLRFDTVMPGAEIKKEIFVENTENTELYARVTVSKYWLRRENGRLEKAMDLNAEKIELDYRESDWLLLKEDTEQLVLYYTKPLAPGERTASIMDQIKISTDIGNAYANTGVGLDIEADAVQTVAAKDAILSEWGVLATIDGNGVITAVEE